MMKQMMNIALEEISYSLVSTNHWISTRTDPKRILLVNGSPKTGTTWVLKLLMSLPGYAGVGNFQWKHERYLVTKPGDVIHGHEPFTSQLWSILASKGIKVILTLRDPRDQAVSRLFHIRRDPIHRWHARFKEMNNDDALMACIEGEVDLPGVETMLNLTRSWLQEDKYAFCVRYEDLLAKPEDRLRNIVHSVGIKASERLIQSIVAKNRFSRLSVGKKIWQTARQAGKQDANSHFRKGVSGDWKNYFNEKHCNRFKEVAGQALIKLGYEKDFNW